MAKKWVCAACLFVLAIVIKVSEQREVALRGTSRGCHYVQQNFTFVCVAIHNTSMKSFVAKIPETAQHLYVYGANFPNVSHADFSGKHFTELTSWTCVRCNISFLSKDIKENVPNMEILNLRYNSLDANAFTSLRSLRSLKVLDLSHNSIQHLAIPNNDITPLLTELDLSFNAIDMLSDPSVFRGIPALQRLDLSSNNLSYIHPAIFGKLYNLSVISLDENKLESLPEELFLNTSVVELHLAKNPWHCHCGISWLMHHLHLENPAYMNKQSFKCLKPDSLLNVEMRHLNDTALHCKHPDFDTEPNSTVGLVWHTFYLHCNATGYPAPSVYWTGPRGVLVHKSQQQFLPSDIHDASDQQSFNGYPKYQEATVKALKNGSLKFSSFRFNYAGNYTCHVVNPLGTLESTVYVSIRSDIYWTLLITVIFGAASALLFLLFGCVVGAVRMCCEKLCCRRRKKALADADDMYEEEAAFWDEYFRHPLDSTRATPDMWPSPVKCITPAEPDKHELSDFNKGIFNTLDAVRSRLSASMGRHVENMRERANHMRETGKNLRIDVNKKVERARYKGHLLRESAGMRMNNFRESSSQTLRTIRSSSGQYAHRMREGVAERVVAVKDSVKSLKEFCGTGTVAHTMTVSSIATNVDSQETERVSKIVTYV